MNPKTSGSSLTPLILPCLKSGFKPWEDIAPKKPERLLKFRSADYADYADDMKQPINNM